MPYLHLQCPWTGVSPDRNNKASPPASLSPSLPSSGPVTGIIRLMVESRTSHRLTTRRISRSCVFLTTPRARGFAATYNQHIFMSRSQTPLLNGASFASLVPGPRFAHLVSLSISLLSFSQSPSVPASLPLSNHLTLAGKRTERAREITRPPWAPWRERARPTGWSSPLAICQSVPGPSRDPAPGPDPTFAFYDFSK